MTFPIFELNVYLAPAFVAAVDAALQSEKAELVLVHATTVKHGTFVVRDYLQSRARQAVAQGSRPVTIVPYETSDAQLDELVMASQPRDLVFFSELDPRTGPGAWQHSLAAAARFADKGATVFATIHGCDTSAAEQRLGHLWSSAIAEGILSTGAVLPTYRFIAFEADVWEVPASGRRAV